MPLRDLEESFSLLEMRIINIKEEYRQLLVQLEKLTEEYKILEGKYDAERKRSQVLIEESKNIKLQAAISGNPDYNRLMKNHITRLIKEVDDCIAQLQNTGL